MEEKDARGGIAAPGEEEGRGGCATEVSMPREERSTRCGGLARAENDGVDAVKSDGKHHPENGGEEKAANDLSDGVSVEKAAIGALVGEALVSGLKGRQRWCLHYSSSIGKNETKVRGSSQAIPQRQ